jgi:uncharacterized protein (TIGR02145 family)
VSGGAVKPPFRKKLISSIISGVVFLLVFAAITNPGESKHQKVASAAFSKAIQNDGDMDNLVGIMGSGFVDATVGTLATLFVERLNFVFFSLTRNKPSDEIIGIGAFGCVWLFADGSNEVPTLSNEIPVTTIETSGGGGGSNTLTDGRDGKTYRTVVIGGKRWMAENLNYQPQTGKSWCYENNSSNCNKYGRLYDWNTARGVCPTGWHLPSRQEWDGLGQAVGGVREPDNNGNIDWKGAGTKLKSTGGWNDNNDGASGNGTDDYGFSALPGGRRHSNGNFELVGDYGNWWTATELGSGHAYYRGMHYSDDNVFEYNLVKDFAFYVRCVAD